MKPIAYKTTATATINGKDVADIIRMAADFAHSVLEELSVYRQRNEIVEDFKCEGEACEFLDMIGD